MKFKRILSLGLVLGAVLSVGMVINASAADDVDMTQVEFPTKSVTIPKDYPLHGTKSSSPTVTGASVSTYEDVLVKDLKNYADADDVKINNSSAIYFHVDSTDCYLTVCMSPSDTGNGDAAILYKKDKTIVQTEDGKNAQYKMNTTYHITEKGDYYISGASGSNSAIEEIQFLASSPTIVALTKGVGDQTTEGQDVSIFKYGGEYYAAVILDSAKSMADKTLTLNNTSSDSPVVIEEVFKGLKDSTGKVYDIDYFGAKGAYLAVVKLNATGQPFSDERAEDMRKLITVLDE